MNSLLSRNALISSLAVVSALWLVNCAKDQRSPSETELLRGEIRDLRAEVEPLRRLASRNYPDLDSASARERLISDLSKVVPSELPLARRQALISALKNIPLPRPRIEVQALNLGVPAEMGKGLETIFKEALWDPVAFAVVWPGQPGLRGINVYVQKRSLIPEADPVAVALDAAWTEFGSDVTVREDPSMGNDYIAIRIGPQ